MRDRSAIEHLVRDLLGCTCPEEVFERIEDSGQVADGDATLRRIAVGGRLLIYLVEPGAAWPQTARLREWVERGTAERDRLGLNRFRLVIAADDRDAAAGCSEPLGAPLTGNDERAHLHLIPRAAIADL